MTYSCTDFTDHILNTMTLIGLLKEDDIPLNDPEGQMRLAVHAILDLASDVSVLTEELNRRATTVARDSAFPQHGLISADEATSAFDGRRGISLTGKLVGFTRANKFWAELMGAVESLGALCEKHGQSTLIDIAYLHNALLTGGRIDHFPGRSGALGVARALPSGSQWEKFVNILANEAVTT